MMALTTILVRLLAIEIAIEKRVNRWEGIELGLPTFAMSGLGAQSFQCIRSHFNQDGILGRLSKEDLAFYDGIAERIRDLIEDSHRGSTIATLAGDIGWGRSSLLNFLNRKTQTIPTHLLVRAAKSLKVPASYLMIGD